MSAHTKVPILRCRPGALLLSLIVLAGPGAVEAQQPDHPELDRLDRAYPAAVVERASRLLDRAETEGLPRRALAEKALEGAAKRVPGDRLIEALERRLSGLRRASDALGAARRDPASVEAGAVALREGLAPEDVRRIGEVASGAERPAALAVLGELHHLGIPVDVGLDAVEAALERDGAGEVLALATRVRAAARDGKSPREALRAAGRAGFVPGLLPGTSLLNFPAGAFGPPVPVGSGPPSIGPTGGDLPVGGMVPSAAPRAGAPPAGG